MNQTSQDAIKLVMQMNNDELNRVIKAVNVRRANLATLNTVNLNIGDQVSFKGRGGITIKGTVEKINSKTIVVKQSNSTVKWRVYASLLTQTEQSTV